MKKKAPEIVISEVSPDKAKARVHRFAPRPVLIKMESVDFTLTDE